MSELKPDAYAVVDSEGDIKGTWIERDKDHAESAALEFPDWSVKPLYFDTRPADSVEVPRELLDEACIWLKSCLNCKTWNWDGDQKQAATECLQELKALLTEED